jgi:cytochrome c oxidase subunit II
MFLNFFSYCDAPQLWQLGLQDPATPMAEGMHFFHNFIMSFVIAIGFFVYWLLYASLKTNTLKSSKFSHSNIVEIVWTIIPAIILLIIAVPSFSLLYALQAKPSDIPLTLKVIGHQWYWSYEYSLITSHFSTNNFVFDAYVCQFDSHMIADKSDLIRGTKRLLEVDRRVVLPRGLPVRLIVTSADVIHSWAIPSLGIKIDAIPGRLSEGWVFIKREGLFFGQCSEICGVNHAFMPIVIRSINSSSFLGWLYNNFRK